MFNNVPDAAVGFSNIPLVGGGNSFYNPGNIQNYANPNSQTQLGAQTQPVQNNAPSTNGTGTGGAQNPGLINAINSNFGQQQQGYRNQLGLLDPARDDNINSVNNQYGAQQGTLQHQYDQGQTAIDTSKARTFRDLSHQMSGMISGYNNQLGTYGAGDSSAAGMIGQAVSNQGNRQIGDLNQQAQQQFTGLKNSYTDQLANLNAWKQDSINKIGQAYASTQAQLNAALGGSMGAQAQALAYAQQNNAAQDVMNQLQALDQNHYDAHAALAQSYQNAPTTDLSKYQSFTPNTQSVQGLNLAPTVGTDYATAPAQLQKRPDQQY